MKTYTLNSHVLRMSPETATNWRNGDLDLDGDDHIELLTPTGWLRVTLEVWDAQDLDGTPVGRLVEVADV